MDSCILALFAVMLVLFDSWSAFSLLALVSLLQTRGIPSAPAFSLRGLVPLLVDKSN